MQRRKYSKNEARARELKTKTTLKNNEGSFEYLENNCIT